MITERKHHERGLAEYSWLKSQHTFSFAHYYDPKHMGVSALRVINDDIVSPGAGFETHPHRNMEIISYVLDGKIEHKDTMGYHTVLNAGDVQVMSAGSGILHSEYNPSDSEDLNFLQIWIRPDTTETEPRYFEKNFSETEGVTLIVSPSGEAGSLAVRQDAYIYKLNSHHGALDIPLATDRTYYLHIAKGEGVINGLQAVKGDGFTLNQESQIDLTELQSFEALLFDLPKE